MRFGSALLWLWLWRRPATEALIRPLTWELPYVAAAALKRQEGKKKKGRKEGRKEGRKKERKIDLPLQLQFDP